MGLFGSNNKALPKLSEVFSAEAIKKIYEVAGPKLTCNGYGKYTDYAQVLITALREPDGEMDKRAWDAVMFSSGVLTKVEPELTDVLKEAIAKYKTLKKSR